MAVAVTSTNSNQQIQGARMSFCSAAGIPYVLTWLTTGKIEMFKGNSTTPTSFSAVGTGPNNARLNSPSGAIDSTGVIHVSYYDTNGKSSALNYATFTIATDTWAIHGSIQDIGAASPTNPGTAIAVDANNIPHIAWVDSNANMGTNYDTIYYTNKIGGSWNTAVEVEGQANEVQCKAPDITIDANNLPAIAYYSSSGPSAKAAIGDTNNATSFTLQDIDGGTTANSTYIDRSIVVDSSGNHYVGWIDSSTTQAHLTKHNYGDAWSSWSQITWSSPPTTVHSISLGADGTDIYVFVEDSNNDVAYGKYTGSLSGSTVLETGTYNTARARWAYAVNNDSTGTISRLKEIDSYHPTGALSSSAVHSASEGGAGQSFTGDGSAIHKVAFRLAKQGSPTGNAVVKIYAHSGTFGTSSVPDTGTTHATSNTFDVSTLTSSGQDIAFTFASPFTTTNGTKYFAALEFTGGDSSNYVIFYRFTTSPTHAGNFAEISLSSWAAAAGTDAPFYILNYTQTGANELDYTFTDETATPDVQFGTLSLAVAEETPGPPPHAEVITWQ